MPQGVQGALLVPVLGIVDQGPWFGSGVRVTAGSFLGLLTRFGDLMKVTHFGLLAGRGDLWKNLDFGVRVTAGSFFGLLTRCGDPMKVAGGCVLPGRLVRDGDHGRGLGFLFRRGDTAESFF